MNTISDISILTKNLGFNVNLIKLFDSAQEKSLQNLHQKIRLEKKVADGIMVLADGEYVFKLRNNDIIAFLEIEKRRNLFINLNSKVKDEHILGALFKDCHKDYEIFKNQKAKETIRRFNELEHKRITLKTIENFLKSNFNEINTIKIVTYSLDRIEKIYNWEEKFDFEVNISENLPNSYLYIAFNKIYCPNLYLKIVTEVLENILHLYYSNRIEDANIELLSENSDIVFAETGKQINLDSIFNSIKKFFNCSYISFWRKKIHTHNVYSHVQSTKEMNTKDSSIVNISFEPNEHRPYGIHILDFEEEQNENKEFCAYAKANEFVSSIYVPIFDSGTTLQNGVLLIFSKEKIQRLSNKEIEFLNRLVNNINDLMNWHKIHKLFTIKKDLENSNTKEIIEKVLEEISISTLAKSVFLYPNEKVINIEEKYFYYGEISKGGYSIIKKNINSNFDLVNEVFSDINQYYCITNESDYEKFIIKKIGSKKFDKNQFKNSFYFIEELKSFIVFHIRSYKNDDSIGTIFINFDKPVKSRTQYRQLVKFYAYYIGEILNMHKYKVLVQNQIELVDLKRRLEIQKRKKIELKKNDIEMLYLNKMPEFFQTEYFLIFQSLFHDVKSLLSASREAWEVLKVDLNSQTNSFLLGKVKKSSNVISGNEKRIRDILKLFEYEKADIEDNLNIFVLLNRLKSFFTPFDYDEDEYPIKISVSQINEIPEYRMNKTKFSMIFYNLFTNSLFELDKNVKGEMKIEISLHFRQGFFTILFCDNGNGIEGIEEDKIFELGETSKGDEGLGIGLFFVKEIVTNEMEGNIRYYRKNNNSFFELVFPQKY